MKQSYLHSKVGHHLAFLLLIFLLASCGQSTRNLSVEPVKSSTGASKIPLKVKLVLGKEFRNFKPAMYYIGSGDFIVPLAEPLLINTKSTVSEIFETVIIDDNSQNIDNETYQAILEPKAVLASWNRPKYANNDMQSAIFLEWSFADKTGKLIWVDTVKGFGVARITKKADSLNLAVKDLFTKSYERIYNAYEIRRFTSKKELLVNYPFKPNAAAKIEEDKVSVPSSPKYGVIVNPNEPWTGTWKITGHSRGAFVLKLKQSGNTVKSIRGSDFNFKGKVKGDRLKGWLPDNSDDIHYDFKVSGDFTSFKGVVSSTRNLNRYKLKGERQK